MELFVLNIQQAPWYVWAIGLCGITITIQTVKGSWQTIHQIINFPAAVLSFSAQSLKTATAMQLWYFGTSGGIGILTGYFFYYATPFMLWRAFKATTIPGAYHSASMLGLFFGIKYLLGSFHGNEVLQVSQAYKNIDFIVSGFFVGYFTGALLKYIQKFTKKNKE